MARIWNQFESNGFGPQSRRNMSQSPIKRFMIQSPIKRDVFLNQYNEFIKKRNNLRKPTNDQTIDEDMPLLEEILFPEVDLDSESMLGCVCCDSCQLRSQQFKTKTNQMLDQFRREMFELKDNVRKELGEVNSKLNQMRLMFAKLLLDIQTKLNKKNSQLDKVLDISRLFQQTNDYLRIENKQLKQRMDKVIKDNIIYRNKLGFDVKIVLNRKECDNYLKKMAIRKKLNAAKAKAINDSNDKISSEVKVEKSRNIEPKPPIPPNPPNNHNIIGVTNQSIVNRSPDKTFALCKVQNLNDINQIYTPFTFTPLLITPITQSNPPILHCNQEIKRKSPQKARTRSKLTHLESNSNLNMSYHNYSKRNVLSPSLPIPIPITDTSSHTNVDICRQNLESEINGFFNKYQSNIFNNKSNQTKHKKRKVDLCPNNTPHRNGMLPINGVVKTEAQTFENLFNSPILPSKDFSEHKNREKDVFSLN